MESSCPVCKVPLKGGFSCKQCFGFAASFASKDPAKNDNFFGYLAEQSKKQPKLSQKNCPSCGKTMNVFSYAKDNSSLELDFCLSCKIVWFDTGEIQKLKNILNPPKDDDVKLPDHVYKNTGAINKSGRHAEKYIDNPHGSRFSYYGSDIDFLEDIFLFIS